MQRMINILHERYTQEQLDGMPQYQRLMSLYREGQFSISGFNYYRTTGFNCACYSAGS